MFTGLIDLGIAFLLAVVFAEYTKYRTKAKKGFPGARVCSVRR